MGDPAGILGTNTIALYKTYLCVINCHTTGIVQYNFNVLHIILTAGNERVKSSFSLALSSQSPSEKERVNDQGRWQSRLLQCRKKEQHCEIGAEHLK